MNYKRKGVFQNRRFGLSAWSKNGTTALRRMFVCLAAGALLGLLPASGTAQGGKPATGKPAAHTAPVLLRCDVDCAFSIDGGDPIQLRATDTKIVQLRAGQHLMEALDHGHTAKWSKVISVTGTDQIVVIAEIAPLLLVWTDPATGLTWAKQDNGSAVDWNQANNYCSNLKLGGYTNWRLATIGELAAIYEPGASSTFLWNGNTVTYHIKGGIQLSGWWIWSNSQNNASGEAWRFSFGSGKQDSAPRELGSGRAVCVRGPGE